MNQMTTEQTFIEFSFGLTTCLKDGVEKKPFDTPKGWNKLAKSAINPFHNGRGILTGKINNLTVFDFDNMDSFDKFWADHPKLNMYQYYMVQSRRGWHMYFQYDETCKTGTNVSDKYADIDIRNDGGFITAPPTEYKLLDGSTFKYEYTGGKILPVPTEFKECLKSFKKETKKETQRKPPQTTDNRSLLAHVLPILESKADSYQDWVNVGIALKHTDESFIDLFHEFSKLCPQKYDESACDKAWNGINDNANGLKLGSIIYWAKQVDPIKTAEILKSFGYTDMSLWASPFTTGLIADYFKELHGDKFICVDECVYHYSGVVWEKEDKKNSRLTNFFDKVFHKELMEYATKELTHYTTLLPDQTAESKIKKITQFIHNLNGLRNSGTRKGMLDDIVAFITVKVEFDNNPYLFAFNNKVYDLKRGEFVEPRPEFYITKTAGYDYVAGTDRSELMALLRTILQPDVLDDWLTTMATGLCGFQMENLIIETGCGRNGKGLTSSLMLATVGDYGYTLPSSTLLSEIKTGANPEIANLNNKRYVVTSEPPKDRKINCATMKSLTGDKTINARGLYSSNCKTNLCLTMVLECNDLPLLDEVIVAVVQRLRVIPFNNTFVNQEEFDKLDDDGRVNVGVTNPYYKTEEFQIASRCAFFDILREHFAGFVANGYRLRSQPKACVDKCRDYLAVSDNVYSWMTEFYEKGDGLAIALSDIYGKFKDSEVFSNFSKLDKRKYSRKYFCEQLEKNLFLKQYVKLRKTRYNGVQLDSDSLVGWRVINHCELGGQSA